MTIIYSDACLKRNWKKLVSENVTFYHFTRQFLYFFQIGFCAGSKYQKLFKTLIISRIQARALTKILKLWVQKYLHMCMTPVHKNLTNTLGSKLWVLNTHTPFYSAPSIFGVFRNLVGEIWFEKPGSRKVVLQTRTSFLVREKWLTRKTGGFIL